MWARPLARAHKDLAHKVDAQFQAQPEHRLPRSTRQKLHSLEILHEQPQGLGAGEGMPPPRSGDERMSPSRASASPERQASPKKKRMRSKKGSGSGELPDGHDGEGHRRAGEAPLFSQRFSPKGVDMELSIESVQVQGLHVTVGTGVEVEVYVGKNIGAEAHKSTLSRKKVVASQDPLLAVSASGAGATTVEWGRLAPLAVDGDMLDEGVVHVRVVEPKFKMGLPVGERKCLGTAAIALCLAARHEDVEEDVLQHGKWVQLLGAGSESNSSNSDEQEREAVPEAALRLVLVVRAGDSGHAHLDRGRDAVNRREFTEGMRLFEAAKDIFLHLHNTRMAAQALELLAETARRRSLTVPLTVRRIAQLQKYLAVPATPPLSQVSLPLLHDAPLLLGGGQRDEDAGACSVAAGAALTSVPQGVCVAQFAKGGDGDLEVGGGDGVLEDGADVIMDPHSFKRMMRGMARHLTLDDVGKALAVLPPRLSDATKKVTAQLIATLDAHINASSALLSPVPKARGGGAGGARAEAVSQDALLFELRCHEQVRKRHISHVVGVEKIVEDVCHYVFDRSSHARPVYVVEGEARGVGVSTLMANVAERVAEMLAQRRLPGRVISRFVGATGCSRHVEPLVHGIVLEMLGLTALEKTLGDEFDKKGNGPGLTRLLQQPPQFFRKLRAQQAVIGGLAELSQEFRNLAELASGMPT